MTKYETGIWHGWNGGECPVHPETMVEYQCYARGVVKAANLTWEHDGTECDIIAFRVTKEHKEPRAVWMSWSGSLQCWMPCDPNHECAVLFREVVE